ncbi:carbohydrate sulfotransferase 14-like [Mercenaria mercenaria]|uniref:carbohydrate sulfotransferase 14-like n=1 Tax=Mercenaria mercenaria TaxID=6596 RepID=UPI00234E4083|nr:carbohydrate sulfotransferase 14-like [Mercenaria mercenaria]
MIERERRLELPQSEITITTSKVQQTVMENVQQENEGARYITENKSMKQQRTQYTNNANDSSNDNRRPNETYHYWKDERSDYIKTIYITHKLLNDNGQNLTARQRAKFVRERCKSFLQENNILLYPNTRCKFDGQFMISRRYNLAICYNCKVASTNTKRVLYALDHNFTENVNSLTRRMVDPYSRQRKQKFQQVMSEKRRPNIMFIREPLERLLSAYRNKRAYTKEFTNKSFSFRKYLQLIINENMIKLDRHIYPYFERCRPCEMQYDLIGLLSNFYDDTKMVLKVIGASGKTDIPERFATGYESDSSDKFLQQYYQKVPDSLINKLWLKYYKDYYIFGFPYPAHLLK